MKYLKCNSFSTINICTKKEDSKLLESEYLYTRGIKVANKRSKDDCIEEIRVYGISRWIENYLL